MNQGRRLPLPRSRMPRLRRAFFLAAAIFIGGVILPTRPSLAAPVWSDPLTGSQIDPKRWVSGTTSADVSLAPSSDGVLMSIAGSAHGGTYVASLSSLCWVAGDFDIQVDYKLGPWPSKSGVRSALIGATQSGFGVAIQRDSLAAIDVPVQSPGSEVYLVDFEPHSGTFPDAPTTDVEGTLRIARIGIGVSAYFASPGGSWTMVSSIAATSEPVAPVLQVWSDDTVFNKQSGGAAVLFRNFVVNAGQLNCPDAGIAGPGGDTDAGDDGWILDDAGIPRVGGGKTGGCSCALPGKSRSGLGLLCLGLAGLGIAAVRRRR